MLDSADEARAQPLDRSREFGVIEALRELAEDHLQFEPRQVCAETEMLPEAECDMRIRITADVELERLLENLFKYSSLFKILLSVRPRHPRM